MWPDEVDFLISFGYRHIIPAQTLDAHRRRAINIHISLLPWNRGADPNFWSWFDRTPKGVSIHAIDEGIDTGDILAQLAVDDRTWTRRETLRSSHAALVTKAAFLFSVQWPKLRKFNWEPLKHYERGSYHRVADKEQWMNKLSRGWDTSVTEVEELGSSSRNN